jgi:micrococcal nuclease
MFNFFGLLLISSTIISPVHIEGNNVRVIDGDTIAVKQQMGQPDLKVRLACIDAPELKQPFGDFSKKFLETLVKNQTLTMYPFKTDIYGRTIASITLYNQITLQQLMVSSGMAFLYKGYKKDCPQYNTLNLFEQKAMEEKIGIWGQPNVVFPWDFRKKK